MEEMLAHSGIVQASEETTDAKEKAPHRLATHLKEIGQRLSPIRRAFRKLSGDGLLGFIVYAFIFVGVFNSSTNSMQFAKLVLVAANAEQFSEDAHHQLDRDLLRFIAVAALSIICLVQFFSPKAGRRFNNLAAVVKILFVLLLIVFGAIVANNVKKSSSSWTETNCAFSDGTLSNSLNNSFCSTSRAETTLSDAPQVQATNSNETSAWAKALLLVLFSFEGWENATFVSTRSKRRALPAVSVVTNT